ncbi:MAG: CPBP family intramembrane glutamic endopeptidase [Acidobacteriota bacterium]
MVDQLASAESCRVCGALLNKNQFQADGLCSLCAVASSHQASDDAQAESSAPIGLTPFSQEEVPPDPDNPRWGPLSGIGVWVASVATIILIPIIAVIAWYLIEQARGAPLPSLVDKEQLIEWLKSPNLLLVQVLSTIVAHGITLAVCWAVVTKLGERPFWSSLGWNWAGHSFWYWAVFSACVIVALLLVSQLLSRFLPQSEENSFAELLKSSQQVRIAIAVLATFTAPLVEETVYRGVLFSALRRSLGVSATVLLVTVMFAGVHVLQYFGAWVSVAGLTLLSLALTVIRARTKSILPCVLIHTLNNAFFSMIILVNKGS